MGVFGALGIYLTQFLSEILKSQQSIFFLTDFYLKNETILNNATFFYNNSVNATFSITGKFLINSSNNFSSMLTTILVLFLI